MSIKEQVYNKFKWKLNKPKENQIATTMMRYSGGVNVLQKEHNEYLLKALTELERKTKEQIYKDIKNKIQTNRLKRIIKEIIFKNNSKKD